MKSSQLSKAAVRLGFGLVVLAGGGSGYAQSIVKTSPVGSGIYELAIDQHDGAVYVASVGKQGNPAAYIYKLDPETLAVTDSIPMGDHPAFGVGIDQGARVLYTSNTRSNTVSAVDLKTKQVIATINNGKKDSHTREVVVDEKNDKVYVSDVMDTSNVWVIDAKTHAYLYSLENTGKWGAGLALDAKKGWLYITAMGANEVLVFDVNTRQRVKSFPSGSESPLGVSLDQKGGRLFVSDSKNGVVTVLNAASGELIQKITVGKGSISVQFDPTHNRIYTANRDGKSISVIDGKSYAVLKTLTVEGLPNTVAIHPKSGLVYVSNKQIGNRRKEGEPAPVPLAEGDAVTLIAP